MRSMLQNVAWTSAEESQMTDHISNPHKLAYKRIVQFPVSAVKFPFPPGLFPHCASRDYANKDYLSNCIWHFCICQGDREGSRGRLRGIIPSHLWHFFQILVQYVGAKQNILEGGLKAESVYFPCSWLTLPPPLKGHCFREHFSNISLTLEASEKDLQTYLCIFRVSPIIFLSNTKGLLSSKRICSSCFNCKNLV